MPVLKLPVDQPISLIDYGVAQVLREIMAVPHSRGLRVSIGVMFGPEGESPQAMTADEFRDDPVQARALLRRHCSFMVYVDVERSWLAANSIAALWREFAGRPPRRERISLLVPYRGPDANFNVRVPMTLQCEADNRSDRRFDDEWLRRIGDLEEPFRIFAGLARLRCALR